MARLYWRGKSAGGVAVTMIREGQLTGKRSLRHMRRVSKAVLKTAVDWSPVDWKGKTRTDPPHHELERSHRIEETKGAFRRIEARIVVGGMVDGVNVDKYAWWVHDSLGWHQRGPATIAKGPNAGPGWLERALEEHQDEFEPLLEELLDGLLR